MSFGGFGKESGPTGTGPRAQSTVQFPRGPSPSAPRPVSPGSVHTLNWGPGKVPSFKEHGDQTYQRSPDLLSQATSNNSRNGTPTEVQNSRTSSPNSTRFPTASMNYMGVVPRAQAPQVYQKIYASDHRPRTQGIQQHSSMHPVWGGQLRPTNYNTSPPSQERLSSILTTEDTYKSGPMFQPMRADVPLSKQIRSPTTPSTTRSTVSPDSTVFRSPGHKRSLIDYRDLDAPEVMPSPSMAIESSFSGGDATHPVAGSEKPFTSSRMRGGQTKSSGTASLVQETTPSFMTTRGTYQSGKTLQTKNATSPLPKRTRSPAPPSTSEGLPENPAAYLDANQRPSDFQRHSQSFMSGPTSRVEVAGDKSMQFPSIKRIKTPPPSSSNLVFPENLDPAQESERELLAKEKRLARFKDELSQPVQSNSMDRNQGIPTERHHQPVREKQNFSEDPTVDVMADSGGGNFDNEGMASSSSVIVGLCPDMCPESERAERERKGDLDQYERVDGDRNLSSEFLAIKKYTRTAEREAKLIRPIPILQKTMDYLLNLLSEPYDDRFLGLYNFLWDRMRAIRMDLRMQHIFNLEAIYMLEQMIRLHIIAMHELCEYTKGEGFAEGFDAHLNIEQMNKTSVELFQLYDDHRKKGIHVPSEHEFRGYYALLKLDKHPGYKVEPAELSLDLAKMTPEIRQTPEVLFARDVARACRMGNFISFFRLANKASYLQGCLMHAHFSKLRTQALASLHSGLQINQGIPIAHVAKWLGMEEEDMDELLEYHGFSVKEFKEPYMMKESAFLNADTDFPIKRSKLVDRKRSVAIVSDVAFPSLTESYTVEEVPRVQVSKSPEPALTRTVSSLSSVSTGKPHDEEMHDLVTISSPKANMQQFKSKVSVDLVSPDEKMAEYDVRVVPTSPFVLGSSPGSADNNQKRVDSPQKPKFESVFRNSFGRSHKQESETIPPVTLDIDQDIRYPISPRDSVVQTPIPQPLFPETPEDEEQIRTTEEDGSDDLTSSYYDQEVYEAKLKLILRIWKRRTEKKKELREQKKLAASAAMSLLSMGPPMWQYENPSTNYSMFNIDHVMSERYELQERSSVVLNPSHVVAAKLAEKNPDAKYLCWKIVVCSLAGIPGRDDIELQHDEATQSWFQSKLMPANYDSNGDLVTSSPGLAIWRSWSPSLSGDDMTCCISVIRSAMLDNLNDSVAGTSAILFILSDYAPIEPQRRQLHDLVASLPSGSRLPLLIMDGSGKDESDTSSIVKSLGLPDIDKSRVIAYNIHFLKDTERKKSGGFLSDKLLREGIEWLASESPPQIVVNEIKTRELVLSYLNPALEILDEMSPHGVGPNTCISAFNEALNRTMKEVTAAVDANPTGWPCPEIEMLNQSNDEYRGIACYLPGIGWSSASRTEVLMHALQNSILPYFEDDLSWLSRGFRINDDINSQTSYLGNCLINYLTVTSQMMGVALAEKEARIALQKCVRLELHDTTYRIIPQWVSIFRRIYNWRLMNLTNGEVFSAYVLQQHYTMSVADRVDSKTIAFSPPYLVNPSLDELLDVGCRSHVLKSNYLEHEDLPVSLPVASCNTDALTTNDSFAFVDKENNDGVVQAMDATEDTKQADRLSELLEKCNIMQNLIDKKLSIYF